MSFRHSTFSTPDRIRRHSQVNELLSRYGPEVRGLALKARELVLGLMPDATEHVDTSAKIIGYGFGTKYAGSAHQFRSAT